MKTAKKNRPKKSELFFRRRYTRVVMLGGKWNTYLQIDHQGFCVTDQASKRHAVWFAQMLAKALARMVEKENKK